MGAIATFWSRPRFSDAVLYGLSAAFASLTAVTSTLLPHRAWGAIAWWGYTAAFLITFVALRRLLLTFAVFAAVTLVPLITQAVQRAGGRTDRAQEEVHVVEQMGQRLLDTGTPYLDRPAITALPEPERLLGYSPYQPGMAIFGIPRAVLGDHWWTDARVWFAAATIAALLWTLRLLADLVAPPGLVLVAQSIAVLPICTLTLTTGGDDLPVVSLVVLAMAFTARHRWVAAGVTIGLAGALKLFALPAALVLLVLAFQSAGWLSRPRRGAAPASPDAVSQASGGVSSVASGAASSALAGGDSSALAGGASSALAGGDSSALAGGDSSALAGGASLTDGAASAGGATSVGAVRRAALFALGAFGLPLLVMLPALAVAPSAFVENVLRFPAGHGLVTSPAQSPLPGQLIASSTGAGRTIALSLLVAAGLAIGVWLLRRPPQNTGSAALVVALGLTAAIMLIPSTRFGYLLYPAAFAALWWALRQPAARAPNQPTDIWPATSGAA
ncbi:glycosyltransferase family 87 protein [Dactylosporangium sp. NPDC050688]|uniref:glycosyltransferase family 87 protein n=1 Tax=Dactylosporangium sp. NPDC050688 TaxID=3157217 RepID=UPI0034075F7C